MHHGPGGIEGWAPRPGSTRPALAIGAGLALLLLGGLYGIWGVERLEAAEDLNARLLVTLIRILLSTLVSGVGLAALTWGITARGFQRFLARLIESGAVSAAPLETEPERATS